MRLTKFPSVCISEDTQVVVGRLVCPAAKQRDFRGDIASFDQAMLDEIVDRYRSEHSSFGLELKVASILSREFPEVVAINRIRRIYYRLAQEPIMYSYWPELKQSPLSWPSMVALASMQKGAAVERREGEIVSFYGGRGDHLYYEALEESRSCLADIAKVDDCGGDPVKKALYRYARIITAHPLTDANGRLARAVLQGGLAREKLIETPCLALAPTFYLYAAEIRGALGDLSGSELWAAYFEEMGRILTQAMSAVLRVSCRT